MQTTDKQTKKLRHVQRYQTQGSQWTAALPTYMGDLKPLKDIKSSIVAWIYLNVVALNAVESHFK